jgi:hypothetical protein
MQDTTVESSALSDSSKNVLYEALVLNPKDEVFGEGHHLSSLVGRLFEGFILAGVDGSGSQDRWCCLHGSVPSCIIPV